jgi:hypothetical protein
LGRSLEILSNNTQKGYNALIVNAHRKKKSNYEFEPFGSRSSLTKTPTSQRHDNDERSKPRNRVNSLDNKSSEKQTNINSSVTSAQVYSSACGRNSKEEDSNANLFTLKEVEETSSIGDTESLPSKRKTTFQAVDKFKNA